MIRPLLFLAAMMAVFVLQGQRPDVVWADAHAPTWVTLLNAEHPNVFEIQAAYQAYYDTHPFEKNTYTQYYKRFMRWARPYTQADGSVVLPSLDAQKAFDQKVKQLRGSNKNQQQGDWTFAGPNRTFDVDGVQEVTWQTNIYSFDIAPSDANILYAGGETGGIWKTTDKGLHWTLLTLDVRHSSFGAVKIHHANSDIVYAATGGKVIKTTDGGQTWQTVYEANGFWADEIAISSTSEAVVCASEAGLIRSTDGGNTWENLYSQRVWAVKQKPGDGHTLWAIAKAGNNCKLLESTDAGASFHEVNTSGWYQVASGQQVTGAHIGTCPSNPSKVYAYLAGEGGNLEGYIGVFVSTDNGLTWANTNPNNAIGNSPTPYAVPNHVNLMDANGTTGFTQGFYDMAFVVDPTDDNKLFAGGTSWFRSLDGGQTWLGNGGYAGGLGWAHPDIQCLRASGNELWIASDGGLNYSTDFGNTHEARMNGISGADLWGFDAGWNDDILVGGRYHNGNMAWRDGFPATHFYRMGGAEAATGYVNPGPGFKTYFSDIGGYSLLGSFNEGVSGFPVGMWPNESYAYYQCSEMEFHPNCWNTVFMGYQDKLWRSDDGGASYVMLADMPGGAGNQVYDIEICRSHPDYMYLSHFNGTDDVVRRSTDGGATWTLCANLPTPNNNDRIRMAVSETDPLTLWVSVTYGSNGKKVFKTTDGGVTWQNMTSPLLDGLTVTGIMMQYGTDGGVYIGTNGGVFYRNNTHTDWQPFSNGLPVSAETNRLKPFYRDGKIRNGCWGFGVWESPLYEPSNAIVPVAMCSKLYSGCERDTLYFDDHSAVRHDVASWEWQFPDAAYVSSYNVRNPVVFYGSTGQKMAIMSLSTNGQTYHDTLYVTIGSECSPDSVPGIAVRLGGNNNESFVSVPALDVTTNHFTVTAWLKIDGTQPDYASIFMHDDESAGFNFVPGNNHLGYHWPGGAWWWDSGLTVPDGEWAHVAMVVEPNKVTLYVNGRGATHSITAAPVAFTAGSRLGNYKGWGGRFVKGDIDEVCIYNASLTQADIREKMHLRKIPSDETNMLAYYQFNEPAGGQAYDRAYTRHGALSGASARITSTVAVGPGYSSRVSVSQPGNVSFGDTGFEGTFGSPFPGGEVCVTRINIAPDATPTPDLVSCYWVLHNYGSNLNFAGISGTQFSDFFLYADTCTAENYHLHRRDIAAEGNTWDFLQTADQIGNGPTGWAQYTNPGISTEGQFAISQMGTAVGTTTPSQPAFQYTVSPNPVSSQGILRLTCNHGAPLRFTLFDTQGRRVRNLDFERDGQLTLQGIPAGTYFYRLEADTQLRFGTLIVID